MPRRSPLWQNIGEDQMAVARVAAVDDPDYARRQTAAAYAGVPSSDDREQKAATAQDTEIKRTVARNLDAEQRQAGRQNAAWMKQSAADQKAIALNQRNALKDQGVVLDHSNRPVIGPTGTQMRKVGGVMADSSGNTFAKDPLTGTIQSKEVPPVMTKDGKVVRNFGRGAVQDVTNQPGSDALREGESALTTRTQQAKDDAAKIPGENKVLTSEGSEITKRKQQTLAERKQIFNQRQKLQTQLKEVEKDTSGEAKSWEGYTDQHPASEVADDIKRKIGDLNKSWNAKEQEHLDIIKESEQHALGKVSHDQVSAYRKETDRNVSETTKLADKMLKSGDALGAASTLDRLEDYRKEREAGTPQPKRGAFSKEAIKARADAEMEGVPVNELPPELLNDPKALKAAVEEQRKNTEIVKAAMAGKVPTTATPEQIKPAVDQLSAQFKEADEKAQAAAQVVQQVMAPHQQAFQNVLAEDAQRVAGGAAASPRNIEDGQPPVMMTDEGFKALAGANKAVKDAQISIKAQISDADAAQQARNDLVPQLNAVAKAHSDAQDRKAAEERMELHANAFTKPLAQRLDMLDGDMQAKIASVENFQTPAAQDAARKTILAEHDKEQTAAYAEHKDRVDWAKDAQDRMQSIKAGQELNQAGEVMAGGSAVERALIPALTAIGAGPPDLKEAILKKYNLTKEEGERLAKEAKEKHYVIGGDDKISWEPGHEADALKNAIDDGLIDKKQGEAMQPALERMQAKYEEALKAAGNLSTLKAIAAGASKGGAMMAGGAAGGMTGQKLGTPGGVYGKIVGGAVGGIVGTITAGEVYDRVMPILAQYSDIAKSLEASKTLHPDIAGAAEFASFLVAPEGLLKPSLFFKAATKKGLAEALTPTVVKSFNNIKDTVALAYEKGGMELAAKTAAKMTGAAVGSGAATGIAMEAARPIYQQALNDLQAKFDPLGTLKKSVGTDAKAEPTSAGKMVEAGLQMGGLALLMMGHHVEFRGYDKDNVQDVAVRGAFQEEQQRTGLKVKAENRGFDPRLDVPLDKGEKALYEEIKKEAEKLKTADKTGVLEGAKQATYGGGAITTLGIKPENRSGGGGAPPPMPPAPSIEPPKAKLSDDTRQNAAIAEAEQFHGPQRDWATGMIKLATGKYQGAGGLSSEEVTALGLKIGKDGNIEDAKDKNNPAVATIVNGHPIIADSIKNRLDTYMPAIGDLIGRSSSEAREWAMKQGKPGEARPKAEPVQKEAENLTGKESSKEETAKPAVTKAPEELMSDAEALDAVVKDLKEQGRSHNIKALEKQASDLREQASKTPTPKTDEQVQKETAIPTATTEAMDMATSGGPEAPKDLGKWKEKTPSEQSVSKTAGIDSPGAAVGGSAGPTTVKASQHIDLMAKRAQLAAKTPDEALSIKRQGALLRRGIEAAESKMKVEVGDVGNSAGFEYNTGTGAMTVDPAKAMKNIAQFEKQGGAAAKEWVDQTIQHELFHHVTKLLVDSDPEFEADLNKLWAELSPILKAESAKAYFKNLKVKGWSDDATGAFEFIRQILENEEARKISEELIIKNGDKKLLQKLIDFIKKFVAKLTKLARGEIQPELREPIQRMIAKANELMKSLGKAQESTGQEVSPADDAPAPSVAEVKEGGGSPSTKESKPERSKSATELAADKIIAKKTGRPTELSQRVRDIYSKGAPVSAAEASWLSDNIGAQGDPIAAAARFIVNTHVDPSDTSVPGMDSESEHPQAITAGDAATNTTALATLINDDLGTVYYVNSIQSMAPGQGGGKATLDALKAKAQAQGLPLMLDPQAFGKMTQEKLVKWYGNQGFEPVPGREDRGTMIWKAEAATVKKSPEEPAKVPKSSTQLTFAPKDAKEITDFGKTIPDSDIYSAPDEQGKEDYGLETEPHVTALYGLTEHEPGPVEKAIAGHGPVKIRLGKMSLFDTNPDYDVLKIDVKGKTLHDLNAKIAKLPNANTFPDYKPHVTVAYLKKGKGAKYVGDTRFEGKILTFDTLTFSPPSEMRGATGKPELPLTETRERKYAVNPASDFLHDERTAKSAEAKRGSWIEAQPDKITARDIASNDWEKIMVDMDIGRRGLTVDKVKVMVADAEKLGVITPESAQRTLRNIQPKGKETTPHGQEETDGKKEADAGQEDGRKEVLSPAQEAAPKGAATIETDPAKRQEIQNSIAEGEMILKSGTKTSGEKMTAPELAAVHRSVDSAKAKLGPQKETNPNRKLGFFDEPAAIEPTAPGVKADDVPMELATRAHSGTSFVPDRRGRGEQRNYVNHMNRVWEAAVKRAGGTPTPVAESAFENYRREWLAKNLELLRRRTGHVSTMIAGGSGFPARSMNKKVDAYAKRLNEFVEWDRKAQGRLSEAIRTTPPIFISSDRSDVVAQLQGKLDDLRKQQEGMKAINAAHKAFKKDPASLEKSHLPESLKEKVRNYVPAYSWEPHPIAPYQFTNLSATIRATEDRIARVTKEKARPTMGDAFDGGRVEENDANNRIQIFFDEKPPVEMRTKLKANGFKWAPSEGAWQRQRNANARYAVQELMGVKLTVPAKEAPTVEPEPAIVEFKPVEEDESSVVAEATPTPAKPETLRDQTPKTIAILSSKYGWGPDDPMTAERAQEIISGKVDRNDPAAIRASGFWKPGSVREVKALARAERVNPPEPETPGMPPMEPTPVPATAPAVLKAEAAKPPAVKESQPVSPKVAQAQKKFLLEEVDKALAEAPETLPTVDADGDLKMATEFPDPSSPGETVQSRENRRTAAIFDLWDKYGVSPNQKKPNTTEFPTMASVLGTGMSGTGTEIVYDPLKELETAINEARMSQLPKVTIAVPGDGTFDVINTKSAIKEFKARASKFPTTTPKSDEVKTTAPPDPTAIPPVKKAKGPTELAKAIAPFMSADTTRYVLNFVYSDGEHMVATDGRRLIVHNVDAGGTPSDPIYFNEKGAKVSMEGQYPNWKQIVPSMSDLIPVGLDLDTGRMFQTLAQSKALLKKIGAGMSEPDSETKSTSAVKLYLNPDKSIGLQASSPDRGEYVHNVKPDAMLLSAFNPDFLIDSMRAIRALGHDKFTMHMQDPISPMVMTAPNIRIVTMPMRLAETDDQRVNSRNWQSKVAAITKPRTLQASSPSIADSTPRLGERERLQTAQIGAIESLREQHSPPAKTTSGNATRAPADRARAAADYLGGLQQGEPRANPRQARKSQEKALTKWARENGLLWNSLPYAWERYGANDVGMAEHHVFFDEASGRVVKITANGLPKDTAKAFYEADFGKGFAGAENQFGIHPAAKGDGWQMSGDDSTPLTYLQRIIDGNRQLGDDTVLHGVTINPVTKGLEIITSQRHIDGEPPEQPEFIKEAMSNSGYEPVGLNGYYRASDNTLISDMHTENAKRVGDTLLPFDVTVMHPEGKLRENLERISNTKAAPEHYELSPMQAGDRVDRMAAREGLVRDGDFFVPPHGSAVQEKLPGDTRLYRAAEEGYAEDGQSFSESPDTADAYRHNAGFGGPNLFAYDVNASRTLEVDGLSDFSRKIEDDLPEGVKEWMNRKGFESPLDAWRDYGFGYTHEPLHNSWGPKGFSLQEHLATKADWLKFEDEVPANAITHWLLKPVGMEGVRVKTAEDFDPELTPMQAGYASEKAARAAFEADGIKDAGETYEEFLHRRHCLGLIDL